MSDANDGSDWCVIGDLQSCRPVAGRPEQASTQLWCTFLAEDLALEPGGRVGKNRARCSWILLCRLSEAATARLVGCSGMCTVHFGRNTGVGSAESAFCVIPGVAMGRRHGGQGGRNR